MPRRRPFFSSLFWGSVLILVLGSPAHSTQQYTPEEAAFREISDSLVCRCGCNKMLSICEMQGCHSAEPMRAEIKEKLANGENKDAILAGFVDRYGLVVLSAPPTSGFHLAAWIMPFIALLLGAWVAKRVLGSWRRQTAAAGSGTPDENAAKLSADQQARIEKELQDF